MRGNKLAKLRGNTPCVCIQSFRG